MMRSLIPLIRANKGYKEYEDLGECGCAADVGPRRDYVAMGWSYGNCFPRLLEDEALRFTQGDGREVSHLLLDAPKSFV